MSISLKTVATAVVALAVSAQFTISNAQAGEGVSVNYRLTNWKTVEIGNAEKARSLATTFKQLGCEVTQESHGDHFDVSYRCVKWRSVQFKSHKTAHDWERWLKAAGFEARHEH